jgi:hypothetical protein
MGQQVCAPWTTADKLCNDGSGDVTDCSSGDTTPLVYKWSPDEVILAASNILYARTCYLYPGVCEYAVWPCVKGCSSQRHPCVPCVRYDAIQLPGELTVESIVSVMEDDVELDDEQYGLDPGGLLVRLDGLPWQRNTFGLPGASGVETVVTFLAGTDPPIELQMAAAKLAEEMLKSCNGEDCQLDPRVKSFVRRGVAVELNDVVKLLALDMTGIPEVDRAIQVHGNCGGATMLDTAAPYLGQALG